jgi:methionine-rich copper-binding protein CopC
VSRHCDRGHEGDRLLAGVRVTLIVGLLVLAGCAPRSPLRAHPILIQPPPDAVLGAPPHAAEIAFTAPLAGNRSSLVVMDADGNVVSERSQVDPADPRRLVAPLRSALRSGAYELIWRSVEASTSAELEGQEHFRIEPSAPERPAIAFSSAEVDAGDKLSISGSGFSPSTRVVLTIGDDADQLAVTSSREDGSFVVAALPVPPDLPLGEQAITARDNNGATAARLLRVHWGGWPPLRLTVAARPGPSAGQVTVDVGARNRSDYTLRDVRLVLRLAPGTSVAATSQGGREEAGSVVWDVSGTLERGPLDAHWAILSVSGAGERPTFSAWAQYGHLPERSAIWGDLPGFYSSAASPEARVP